MHVNFLLIKEEGKRYYVLIKDFNTFMYDQKLSCGTKHCCRYCSKVLVEKKILKCHVMLECKLCYIYKL